MTSASVRRAHRIPQISGDEVGALGRHRGKHRWGRGEVRQIKRAYNRRQRKALRAEVSA